MVVSSVEQTPIYSVDEDEDEERERAGRECFSKELNECHIVRTMYE